MAAAAQKSGAFGWLKVNLIALLLVTSIVALYLGVFVSGKKREFSERAFRSLAMTARSLEEQLGDISPRLERINAKHERTAGSAGKGDQATRQADSRSKDVALIPSLAIDGAGSAAQAAATPPGTTSILIDPTQQPATLKFVSAPSEKGRKPLAVATNVNNLIGDLAGGNELDNPGEFDVVAVLANGRVLAQSTLDPSEDRGSLLLKNLAFPDDGKQGDEAKKDEKKKDSPKVVAADGSSRRLEVEIAGTEYLVFLQPVQVPVPVFVGGFNESREPIVVEQSNEWSLAGLVTRSRFSKETLALPANVIVVLLSLVLLAVLAAPILKLWYLGDEERYTFADLALLTSSLLLAGGLLTFLFIDSFVYWRLRGRMDARAVGLADQVLAHFDEELGRAGAELAKFFDNRTLSPDAPDQTALLAVRDDLPDYAFFDSLFWVDKDGEQRQKWAVKTEATPHRSVRHRRYFEEAARGSLVPPHFGVEPASAVRKDSLARPAHYTFEIIRSSNTGETLTCVSMPLPQRAGPAGGVHDVGVIAFQPLSLISPVLPLGVGFCIVDEQGQVLLRAGADGKRQENLLADCEHDGRLRAAMHSRRAELLTCRYRGDQHRLYLRPMGNQPLFLVMLQDLNTLDTINFEAVTSCIVLFLLAVLALLATMGLLRLVWGASIPSWLWPDHRCVGAYLHAIGINLCLAAWLIWSVRFGAGLSRLLLILFLPTLGVAVSCVLISRAERLRRLQRHMAAVVLVVVVVLIALQGAVQGFDLEMIMPALLGLAAAGIVLVPRIAGSKRAGDALLRRSYSGLVLSFALLIGLAPAVVLFRDAFDHSNESFTRLGQLHFAQSLATRNQRLRDRFLKQPEEDLKEANEQLKKAGEDARQGKKREGDVTGPASDGDPAAAAMRDRATVAEKALKQAAAVLKRAQEERLDIYESRRWLLLEKVELPATEGGVLYPSLELLTRHFSALPTLFAPTYDATSRRLRGICVDSHERTGWQWHLGRKHVPDDERAATEKAAADDERTLEFLDQISAAPKVLALSWQIEPWNGPGESAMPASFAIGAIFIAALFYLILSRIAGRLFGLLRAQPSCEPTSPGEATPPDEDGWKSLSDEEKTVLLRLAQGQFVNPRSWSAARSLQAKGVIVKDPSPRFADAAWICFLARPDLSLPARGTVSQGHAPLARVQVPLLVTALVVGLFFFFTQRDQTQATLGFVTALTGAVPALFKMLGSKESDGKS